MDELVREGKIESDDLTISDPSAEQSDPYWLWRIQEGLRIQGIDLVKDLPPLAECEVWLRKPPVHSIIPLNSGSQSKWKEDMTRLRAPHPRDSEIQKKINLDSPLLTLFLPPLPPTVKTQFPP